MFSLLLASQQYYEIEAMNFRLLIRTLSSSTTWFNQYGFFNIIIH